MKIQFASDLHLEFFRDKRPANGRLTPTDADVLVLAGDIDVGIRGVLFALEYSLMHQVPVIYVLGNHEYYGCVFDELVERCKSAAAGEELSLADRWLAGGEVHVLERDGVVIGNTRFLGATLWTDFLLQGEEHQARLMMHGLWNISDYRKIMGVNGQHILPEHTLLEHQKSRAWLEAELAKPHQGNTVVVTHHSPHPELGHPIYKDDTSACFQSDLSGLIASHDIDLWIYGHTHANADTVLHGTRFVANQGGYPGDVEHHLPGASPFDPARTIDLYPQ